MKYTRYDVKSKKKKNDDWKTTLLMIMAVVILAVLIASLIFFKVFPGKNPSGEAKPNTDQGDKPSGDNSGGEIPVVPPAEKPKEDKEEQAQEKPEITPSAANTYTMVQCGYFSTKESAQSVKDSIGTSAKVLSEDGKFRVVCYIGNEEEAVKLSNELTTKEIENTKSRFNLLDESKTDKAIKEMVKSSLEIVNKISRGEATSVKINDFKTWVNALEEETNDDKFNNFKNLKDNINKLPDEVKAEDIEKIYQMVYDVLRVYK